MADETLTFAAAAAAAELAAVSQSPKNMDTEKGRRQSEIQTLTVRVSTVHSSR